MGPDLFLVLGVVAIALSFFALVSAFSASRPPRAAAVLVVTGGALVVWAIHDRPGGYEFGDVPGAFVRVAETLVR